MNSSTLLQLNSTYKWALAKVSRSSLVVFVNMVIFIFGLVKFNFWVILCWSIYVSRIRFIWKIVPHLIFWLVIWIYCLLVKFELFTYLFWLLVLVNCLLKSHLWSSLSYFMSECFWIMFFLSAAELHKVYV